MALRTGEWVLGRLEFLANLCDIERTLDYINGSTRERNQATEINPEMTHGLKLAEKFILKVITNIRVPTEAQWD